MLNAAPRQQASRPDTCWARRALTSYYRNAFRGLPCPIARAGQTQDVVWPVQSHVFGPQRSAQRSHATPFGPPLGWAEQSCSPRCYSNHRLRITHFASRALNSGYRASAIHVSNLAPFLNAMARVTNRGDPLSTYSISPRLNAGASGRAQRGRGRLCSHAQVLSQIARDAGHSPRRADSRPYPRTLPSTASRFRRVPARRRPP